MHHWRVNSENVQILSGDSLIKYMRLQPLSFSSRCTYILSYDVLGSRVSSCIFAALNLIPQFNFLKLERLALIRKETKGQKMSEAPISEPRKQFEG